KHTVTNKPVGTYRYVTTLYGSNAATDSNALVVTVQPSQPAGKKPGTPSLFHNNWDEDGNFTLEMNMWWGENATEWRVYENDKLIYTAPLVAKSPSSQKAIFDVKGKKVGTYTYRVEISNSAGSSASANVIVNVRR
ncbi:MAG: chitinase N-terminal domain-containing protein, partial [Bacilli bacterium]